MVNHDLFSKFQDRFIDKQLEITYDGGTITNSELFAESMHVVQEQIKVINHRIGDLEEQLK